MPAIHTMTVSCIAWCRMKQKMIDCMHEAAEEFRKLTNRTMADTTKRAISENVAIEEQLAKMNEKTTEVHHDNQNLRRCVVSQKHQVNNSKSYTCTLSASHSAIVSGCCWSIDLQSYAAESSEKRAGQANSRFSETTSRANHDFEGARKKFTS